MKLPAFALHRLQAWSDAAGDRPADHVIGGQDDPYLARWYVFKRRYLSLYLHLFLRSDDPRALHDHPWAFNVSILLKGSYVEVTQAGRSELGEGSVKVRLWASPHRVELKRDEDGRELPVRTFFLIGPKVREWGFLCPQGWRPWREYTSGPKGETVGRGCEP